jgi:multiple sugar transport system permease protein
MDQFTRKQLSPSKVLIYLLLGIWSLVCIFPLYWLVITSFKSEVTVNDGPFYVPFFDFMPSLNSWTFILSDPQDNLVLRFFNSFAVGLAATALTMLIGGMAVYGLTRFGKVGVNRKIMAGILATRVLPPIVLVLPIYMMAHYTATLDTRLALIVAYTAINLPVAVWLLHPIFGAQATQQEEAAELDGASHFGIFFTIFLPMVAASVGAVALLIFVLCWNEYLLAAYLASNHAMTLPPWLVGQMSIKEAQVGSEAEEQGHFSAATVLMVLPLLACTVFVQRALSRAVVRNG